MKYGIWDNVINVTNCYSLELSILHDETRQLSILYFGDDENDEIDLTESLSSDDLNPSTVSSDLSSRTNLSNPLVPRDLKVANDILNSIIRYSM